MYSIRAYPFIINSVHTRSHEISCDYLYTPIVRPRAGADGFWGGRWASMVERIGVMKEPKDGMMESPKNKRRF